MKTDKTIKIKNKNNHLSVSKTDYDRFIVYASETFQGWDGPHPCSETNEIKFFFDSKEFIEFLNDLQQTYGRA